MKHFAFPLIFSFVCVMFIGCGSGHVGFRGKVVFSDDGSPLTVGVVCFTTPTFQAKGDLQRDGTFTMGSYRSRDGLPPGRYQVGILAATEDLGDEVSYSLVDPKWGSPKTSGYTLDVDRTISKYEIKVDRNLETREQTLRRMKSVNRTPNRSQSR